MRAAAAATLRTLPRVAARVPMRLRRWALMALAAAALLLSAYWFWFRESSFTRVEKVSVFGLSTSDAPKIRAALEAAAREQSTLKTDVAALEQAVESFPIVRSISVVPDFPHGLTIDVVEHRPAAVVLAASQRVAVNSEGTLLPGVATTRGLPLVRLKGVMPSGRVTDSQARALVATLGAAPALLRRRLLDARVRPGDGIVVRVRQGPQLIFGTADRAAAKWAAAARVMADPKAAGASYIDVRLPERPAAGGLGVETVVPVAPAGQPGPEDAAVPQAAAPGAGAPAPGTTTPQGATAQPQATAPAPQAAQPPATPAPPAAPTGAQPAPTSP